ncbi:MAG: hypothetical protein M4D80_26475 [Myxococcota bacterium]|nr:hypothetical protein [Myxococcota bacterium]
MRSSFAALVFALAACGSNTPREQVDARAADAPLSPDAAPDAASPDAADVPCTYVAATTANPQTLSFSFAGGGFATFGCAPIDPTYWMSGAGMSVTVTFAQPQINPSVRVWGMNTDDTASFAVNGAAFTLDATSASLAPKVVCGLSPGPDGVAFVGGKLAGANTPGQGNYSYQDVTVNAVGVQTIKVTGLSGAGWGFVGASVGCADEPVLR